MNSIDVTFLSIYPNALKDELWLSLGKKHNPTKIIEILNTTLSKDNMEKLIEKKSFNKICEISLKLVKKVTTISVFEKIAFQNFIANSEIHMEFSLCLFDFLHNFNEHNFEKFVNVLLTYKSNKNSNAGKWTIVSFFKAYQNPDEHICVKPTTVKTVARYLDVDIEYKSLPNFNTYSKVLKMIKDFRKKSEICKDENLMITQAVLFCVTQM